MRLFLLNITLAMCFIAKCGAQCFVTDMIKIFQARTTQGIAIESKYNALDRVFPSQQPQSFGSEFLIGGKIGSSTPIIEYSATTGIVFWTKQFIDESLSQVSSIKFLDITGNPMAVFLFNGISLVLGVMRFKHPYPVTLYSHSFYNGNAFNPLSLLALKENPIVFIGSATTESIPKSAIISMNILTGQMQALHSTEQGAVHSVIQSHPHILTEGWNIPFNSITTIAHSGLQLSQINTFKIDKSQFSQYQSLIYRTMCVATSTLTNSRQILAIFSDSIGTSYLALMVTQTLSTGVYTSSVAYNSAFPMGSGPIKYASCFVNGDGSASPSFQIMLDLQQKAFIQFDIGQMNAFYRRIQSLAVHSNNINDIYIKTFTSLSNTETYYVGSFSSVPNHPTFSPKSAIINAIGSLDTCLPTVNTGSSSITTLTFTSSQGLSLVSASGLIALQSIANIAQTQRTVHNQLFHCERNLRTYTLLNAMGALSNRFYLLGSNALTFQLPQPTISQTCSDYNVWYDITMPDFINFDQSTRTMSIFSIDAQYVGFHTISMSVLIANNQELQTNSFILEVRNDCSQATITSPTTNQFLTQYTYTISSSTPLLIPIPSYISTISISVCPLEYTLIDQDSNGQYDTVVVTVNTSPTNQLHIYTTNPLKERSSSVRLRVRVLGQATQVLSESFILWIRDRCYNSQVTSIDISNIAYNVQTFNPYIYAFPAWTQSIAGCPAIIFQPININPAQPYNPSIYTFNATHMVIYTTNTGLDGTTHYMRLRGSSINDYKDEDYQVLFSSIPIDCSTNVITSQSQASETYTLGTALKLITIPQWSSLYSTCGDIEFYLIVNYNDWTAYYLQPIISFNTITGYISVSSSAVSESGLYQMNLTAKVQTIIASQLFTLEIINPCATYAIYNIASSNHFEYAVLGQKQQYNLTPFGFVQNLYVCGEFTYKIESQIASSPIPIYITHEIDTTPRLFVQTGDPQFCHNTIALRLTGYYTNDPNSFNERGIYIYHKCTCQSVLLQKTDMAFNAILGDSVQALAIGNFSFTDFACYKEVTYSYTFVGTPYLAANQISFNAQDVSFILPQAFDESILGTHLIALKGEVYVQGTLVSKTVTVTINILRGCNTPEIQIGGLNVTSLTYLIGKPSETISILDYQVFSPSSCGTFIYSLEAIAIGVISEAPNFITLDFLQKLITIQSFNTSDTGIHTLILTAFLNEYVSFSTTLTITIENLCIPTAVILPQTTLFHTYKLGSPSLNIPILSFTLDKACQSVHLTYEGSLHSGPSSGYSFISFDSIVRAITVSTSLKSNIGIYEYRIRGLAMRDETVLIQNSLIFKIQVVDQAAATNTAPYFASSLSSQELNAGQSYSYQLPSVVDDQNDSIIISTQNGLQWVLLQESILQMTPTSANLGSHSLTITLTDKNANQMFQSYTLSITVFGADENPSGVSPQAIEYFQMSETEYIFEGVKVKKQKLTGRVSASVSDIDQNGIIKIVFDQSMMIPNNKTAFLSLNAIRFTLKKVNGTQISLINQKLKRNLNEQESVKMWDVQDFVSNQLTVKINFPQPEIVSDTAVINLNKPFQKYDSIQIIFSERFFFISNDQSKIIDPNFVLVHQIPPQLSSGSGAVAIAAMTQGAGSALTGAVTTNLFLSVLMGVSLKKLWMMITTLQIMVHMPMLAIYFPPNAVLCFASIVDISNMNIVPKEWIDAIKGVFVSQPKNQTQEAQTDGNFQQMGYKSTNIMSNLGLVFLILAATIFIGLLIVLLRFLLGRFAWQDISYLICSARNIYDSVSKILFFNTYITSTMKGFLNFSITALIGLKNSKFEDPTSIFGTFGITFYVVSLPFLAHLFLRMNFMQLRQESIQGRFGSLYVNYKTETYKQVFTSVLFFIRRLVFSFSIVFGGEIPLLQASIQVVSSMFLISYMFLVRPFKKKTIFYFEVFNEISLLTCSYFLLVFCDILMDNEMRLGVGWYMVAITLGNLGINWLNLMISLVRKLCKKAKRKCKKKVSIEQKPKDDCKELQCKNDQSHYKNSFEAIEPQTTGIHNISSLDATSDQFFNHNHKQKSKKSKSEIKSKLQRDRTSKIDLFKTLTNAPQQKTIQRDNKYNSSKIKRQNEEVLFKISLVPVPVQITSKSKINVEQDYFLY